MHFQAHIPEPLHETTIVDCGVAIPDPDHGVVYDYYRGDTSGLCKGEILICRAAEATA